MSKLRHNRAICSGDIELYSFNSERKNSKLEEMANKILSSKKAERILNKIQRPKFKYKGKIFH